MVEYWNTGRMEGKEEYRRQEVEEGRMEYWNGGMMRRE
jgi:hypothetical protein